MFSVTTKGCYEGFHNDPCFVGIYPDRKTAVAGMMNRIRLDCASQGFSRAQVHYNKYRQAYIVRVYIGGVWMDDSVYNVSEVHDEIICNSERKYIEVLPDDAAHWEEVGFIPGSF